MDKLSNLINEHLIIDNINDNISNDSYNQYQLIINDEINHKLFINLLYDNIDMDYKNISLEEYVTKIHIFNHTVICELLDYFNDIIYYNYFIVMYTNCITCLNEHLLIYKDICNLYNKFLSKYKKTNKDNITFYNKVLYKINKKITKKK